MGDKVNFTTAGGVAVVRIDNPPVNAIDQDVVDGLARAVAAAASTSGVRAIVLIGAGQTFIAGADIKALDDLAWGRASNAPEMRALLRQLEDCPVPVVVAMHGNALGGGLEVAMAGHYRVASPGTRLGQPEVNLGIIPGAEGTQRLPRLVGVEAALDLCVSGKPIAAAEALRLGLVDRVVEGDLAEGAAALGLEIADRGGPYPRTRERRDRLPAPDALPSLVAAAREQARRTRRRMEAPLAAVDAVEAAATMPFEEGCRREREIFFQCVRSDQCRALIHAFLAERGVSKVPGVSKDVTAAPIERVAIVGAGTMGGGIAMACANAGIPVRLTDVTAAAVDAGLATIRRNYDVSVSRGRLTTADVEARMARLHPQTGYEGFETADLIIEAVFENLALKREVFGALDRVAAPGCILATNTSTLDLDAIASATKRPAQVVGLHFFSPANVMRLLEIVRGRATAPATLAAALAIAKRLGKVGVVVGNCPGFVGNRMFFPYMYEAQFLAEDGAAPEQVDRALTDFGMAMGIFAVDDLAGLDVAWRVRQELRQFSDPASRRPLVADRLYELGRFGQKTGMGWYRYGEDRKPQPDPDVAALIESVAAGAGIERQAFTSETLVERTIYALVNEGARVLDEGYALRAADIDVIYMNGYGFPAWRGGPMFYADTVGLDAIHERVSAFHRELGERWRPAPLLARLARERSTFREFDRTRAAERRAAP